MVVYPTSPAEWHKWIGEHLEISNEVGHELYKTKKFPIEKLLDIWNTEFTPSNGYSPDFIPALVRNVYGFLRWIYDDESEPNWRGSDNSTSD
ncbi:MAG: hypothetical protein ACW98Y_15000 [Candidatus Thorarchaeota archaeon]